MGCGGRQRCLTVHGAVPRGAREASADVVAFIDADSTIAEGTFDVIDRTLARGDVIVGVTGVRMSRASAGIAVSTCLIDSVSRVTGVGTGVVFCRRSDWQCCTRALQEARSYS